MKPFYRPTWITIQLDAIYDNIRNIQHLQPSKSLFAVIKANAYGHGDIEVGKVALEAGATGLAVSSLDEALRLREAGIEAPVLVLGATLPSDSFIAANHQISLTVATTEWVKEAARYLSNTPLKVHLKVNTGMNRLGVHLKETLQSMVETLIHHPQFELEGLFTHFATADGDLEFFNQQCQTFQTLIEGLDLSGIRYVHVSNTAATLHHSFDFDQAVRVGLGLYGVQPTEAPLPFSLKPALSLHSQLVQIRWLEAGESVGYGATYQATEGHWMGVIPIGYADGWWRANQGRCVIVDGHECEIIGRVCMDQLMIALPHEMKVGTTVTLIGEGMSAERVAEELETIPYEVFCSLSDRIPRVYLYQGQQVHCNPMRFQPKVVNSFEY